MSTSKLSLAAAAIAVVCIPVGYTARMTTEGQSATRFAPPSLTGSEAAVPAGPEQAPELPDSLLVAEWKRMWEQYGSRPGDLPAFFAKVEEIEDPFRRRAFLSALIAEWARVDPAGGLAFFRGEEQRNKRWQRDLLLQEWIRRDAEGAVAGLMASGDGWEALARGQLTEIARRAPGTIPGLVAKLPGPKHMGDRKVREAFEIAAAGDLGGSRAAAEALTGPNRTQALSGVAMAWGEKDGMAALEWAQQQGEKETRFEIMRSVLRGWARTDPSAALDRVGLVPVGGDGNYLASSTGARVLREAAKENFEATVEWLRENPGKLGSQDLIGLSEAAQRRLVADPAGFLSRHESQGSLGLLMPALSSALLNGAGGVRLDVWEWLRTAPENEATGRLRANLLGGLGWQSRRRPFAWSTRCRRAKRGPARCRIP